MVKKTIKYLFSFFIVYFLAHFLLLLNRGIYWDGWLWMSHISDQNYNLLWEMLADQLKIPFTYYAYTTLGSGTDLILKFKLVTFISWLVAGLALFNILHRKFKLQEWDSLIISLIFVLFPNFINRLEITLVVYSISNAAFFLAMAIYFIAEDSHWFFKIVIKVFAYLLFAISFFMNSYLFFYGIFLLVLLFFSSAINKPFKIKNLFIKFIRPYWLEIILPIIFWFIKQSLGKPKGIYEGTYDFVILNYNLTTFLPYLLNSIWSNIIYGLFWPILNVLSLMERKIFFGIFIAIFFVLWFSFKILKISYPYKSEDRTESKRYLLFLFIGLIIFFVGLFPYMVVGKVPHPYGFGFGMRHTLLLPLGCSLILFGMIGTFLKNKFNYVIVLIFISSLVTFNIYNYFSADMDWFKQKAIMYQLSDKNNNFTAASQIIFNDQIEDYNWLNRMIGPIEYTGYLHKALGGYDKFGMNKRSFNNNFPTSTVASYLEYQNYYLLKDYEEGPIIVVLVDSLNKNKTPTFWSWVKLKKAEFIYSETDFQVELNKKLQIIVSPQTEL